MTRKPGYPPDTSKAIQVIRAIDVLPVGEEKVAPLLMNHLGRLQAPTFGLLIRHELFEKTKQLLF
jgi:hypothetical protein